MACLEGVRAAVSSVSRGEARLPESATESIKPELMQCYLEINSGVCGPETPDLQLPGGPDPIKEPLNRPSAQGRDPELVDTSFASDPLIEEPVTSGADSILWDCDEDDDRDCDREDGNE